MTQRSINATQRGALLYLKGALMSRHAKIPLSDMTRLEDEANSLIKAYYHTMKDWGDPGFEDLKNLRVWLRHEGMGHVAILPILVDDGGDLAETLDVDWEWCP